MRSLRWLVILPAIAFALFADTAHGQTLQCWAVDTDLNEPVYMCDSNGPNPPGSRITAEQRITVNAVVAMTLIAPVGRRRL